MSKVFVLGIDGAFPEYIFGEWLDELPNLNLLVKNGGYARLNSTIPPLSVTAWTSIFTGKNPADTGIFEYIYREDFSSKFSIVTSKNLKEKTVWEIISEQNKKSIVCYALLSWPIKPFNGWMISDSLLESTKDSLRLVHPPELHEELKKALGIVPKLDITNFRDITQQEIIKKVYELTEVQINSMLYLLKNKEWDLFFGVIPLSDRMNHTFWKHLDKKHRKYDADSPFKDTLKDYYKYLDGKIGEMVGLLDDDVKIIVLSDHGIQRMHTRFNLTDWLIKENYLTLKQLPTNKMQFNFDLVDWSKTKAFAIGAYEGQIYINLKGREPGGIVLPEDYDFVIDELSKKLMDLRGDDDAALNTKIFIKKIHFRGKYEENAPDIIIYLDNLQYGCNTSVIGNETSWNPSTIRGIDDATHSLQGICIIKNGVYKNENLKEISYLDIAPTILHELGVDIPRDMSGKIL
ncbi:alkaline phosphatase family protein [Candidatus Pacearchaeota archaeon]|nr:alkaline phosphatase family protein [Candidatus Pacearchaeota archaeon]